ncbi:sulfate permease [Granulosicoccus antarcticus]|uniref:Putative sulfate transporter n=1 Tax=Granulosicoccus antarcticus IMCC3135 TaxID=1192854 RepID=A0A2Z2NS60_9GAMM|nr:sulfate permease [Granulosicoccus antarcticus]ASJ72841.1 putative sulfate transporter [Granulosicoccus antarcticus IMCC3135]
MAAGHTQRRLRRLIQAVAPGLLALSGYRPSWLLHDLAAGLSVAAIALPVGIAYAELAGVPPVVGMYSAIFPLFAYALFGSSRQLMTGPDAATCILIATTLGPLAGGDPERYATLLFGLTIMSGLLFLLAGVIRLGFMANFLSQPILTGYLNGIALLIMVGQLHKLLGYPASEKDFLPRSMEFFQHVEQSHWPTAALGVGTLVVLVLILRFLPRLPAAFVVVGLSILLVRGLGLEEHGVEVLGNVPAGLPSIVLLHFNFAVFNDIFGAAAGLVLVSFTSGVLTAKSFARRNGYEVNANQELIGFGACNLASGLAQGFPVTGADSRTAVNNAMGGKTQMVGLVAGGVMMLVLIYLTAPLAYVPTTALAAVILVSAIGLIDLADLRQLYRMSYREFLLSLVTTLGVLILGVLPGVLLAVALSLIWLLSVESRPNDAVLGRVKGQKGFHNIADYPDARTIPGLLLYRFESNLVFYNADFMKSRVRAIVNAQNTPVEWLVLDASAINIVDATGLRKFDELRRELAEMGVSVYVARLRRHLGHFFNDDFVENRRERGKNHLFQTLKPAIKAFLKHQQAAGKKPDDIDVTDTALAEHRWQEPVELPRTRKQEIILVPKPDEENGVIGEKQDK